MVHLLYILGFIGALGAALVAVPRIWQAIVWTYRLPKRIDEISHLGPVIVGMAQQFQRNGGSSLRDAVVTLQKDVTALTMQTSEQDKTLAEIAGSFDNVQRLAERVDNLAATTADQTIVIRDMKETADKNAGRLEKVENWIEREIAHRAAGDLHVSRLREEVEKAIANEPKAPNPDTNARQI